MSDAAKPPSPSEQPPLQDPASVDPALLDPTTNPLLTDGFPIPFDRIDAKHVEPAIDVLLARSTKALEEIGAQTGVPTWASVFDALDDATELLDRAAVVSGHLESVATTPELRTAWNAAQPKLAAFYSRIALDPALWRVLKAYAETDEARALSGARRRLLDKTLADFRRLGADLPEDDKRKLEAIDVALAEATMTYGEHVLDETNAWELLVRDRAALAGLPEDAITAAEESARRKDKTGYRFTLQAPSYLPLMTYLDDASLRREAWFAYNTRAHGGPRDNGALIREILRLRQAKAELLGYGDFADLVLEDRMAKSGAAAEAFVDDLRSKAEAAFEREKAELLAYRRELEGEGAPALMPWDVGYYGEKLRKAHFDLDQETLRPYFPLESVLRGLFEILHRLYDVRILQLDDVPTWDTTVRTYAMDDATGRRLGIFYADLFPRENKRGGAWMNAFHTAQPGRPGYDQHVGLVCANFTPPVGDKPALLTHDEVETLFHEFGHLMHHMLTRVELRSLAGTNVAWDFVELPSQIMENWCWEREALDLFARHWQTGEKLPEDLFRRMLAARTFQAASAFMRQIGFASLDLGLHRARGTIADPVAWALDVQRRHAAAPLPETYGMVCAFTHLFADSVGYAAGYYSYKWAEVLDADAFTAFKQAGPFDADTGRRFRETILARGNEVDPSELYRSFMGREPKLDALLERSGLATATASAA